MTADVQEEEIMRLRRRAMLVALAVGLLLPQAAAASMTIVEAVGLALEQDSGLRPVSYTHLTLPTN